MSGGRESYEPFKMSVENESLRPAQGGDPEEKHIWLARKKKNRSDNAAENTLI